MAIHDSSSQPAADKIGYWEAVSIGIGGMVGGGIFAVLGLSVNLAHGGAPLAFLLAGAIAAVTAYSYARLSVAFPSAGGTVAFLDRAFGPGLFTGGLNVLLWISYIVMLSLYAYAFGSYGAALFPPESQLMWKHLLISGSVVGITILNLFSARLIGMAEDWIVLIKIVILLLFIALGIGGVSEARLLPTTWSPPVSLVAGGMIIFLAYEGFELIANTAQDIREPARTLPRAFFSAVGFVIVLYVLVAIVVVGSLPYPEIVAARDYALAEAAQPFMGHAGYLMITIAALLSTASAINATVYGSARLSYVIAKDGELPAALERKIWNEPFEGLLITAAATLVIANTADLTSISTMGSAGFLLVFAAANAANAVMAGATSSRPIISWTGTALCLAALGTLIWQTTKSAPHQIWILAAMVALAFSIEGGFRLATGRPLRVASVQEAE